MGMPKQTPTPALHAKTLLHPAGLHGEGWQLLAHQYPKAMLPQGVTGGKGPLREEAGAAWRGEESQLLDHPMAGGGLVYQHSLPGATPFHFRLSQPSRHQ